ncbi:hypothetical protein OKA06_17635 [Novosphingobium sp. MW5]|nr:hypothetical protein [Novosphingobium sp. MW5]
MKYLKAITASIGTAALLASACYVPAALAQDSVWGPWQKVKCERQKIDSPFGGRNIDTPNGITLDGKEPRQCTWKRQKNDCPKLSSKLRHPIKCLIRFQEKTTIGENPPSN